MTVSFPATDGATVSEILDDGTVHSRSAFFGPDRAFVTVRPVEVALDDLLEHAPLYLAGARRDRPGLARGYRVDPDGVTREADLEALAVECPALVDSALAALGTVCARTWRGPWLAFCPVPPELLDEV